ncbi:acetyltransferase [Spizellomyces punctatus DAOM BR117]|uniref:Acetyltransferase n=1 Tax=Spizellomyces punctatus (strain DAOM BR117) TaxID=645134 RepID=A0A0L0HPP2_SPIPD|nr:acetyltransferase [Spizellomyces punctatus DAOM BR117]KND03376.1 acetyltransferase [Spizellomyces punctatus DAOM BR117]|eukprot:XP_016611415.1 acetyltransferase [Spizellomyces punctatus DAOM BR117]
MYSSIKTIRDQSMRQFETERLLLRQALPTDLEEFHKIFSNADAMTYWSRPPHTTLAESQAWLASMMADPSALDFAIILKSNTTQQGRLIGKIGVYAVPEIGIILHPDVWKQGLASEAMQSFLQIYWTLKPREVYLEADVDPRNTASLNLFRKFGFIDVGTGKGTYTTHLGLCDSVYLRLDRPNGF